MSPTVAGHPGPGRFWKNCGFYLNCTGHLLQSDFPDVSKRACTTMDLDGKPIWQHPGCLIVFSGICVQLTSSQRQRQCLYSLFPGLGTLFACSRNCTFLRGVSEQGVNTNPSDLSSSSLILFEVMSHPRFNPSLEVFILIIVFISKIPIWVLN